MGPIISPGEWPEPDCIPPEEVADVLAQLVETHRAVPPEKWISSLEYRAYRAKIDQDAEGGPSCECGRL